MMMTRLIPQRRKNGQWRRTRSLGPTRQMCRSWPGRRNVRRTGKSVANAMFTCGAVDGTGNQAKPVSHRLLNPSTDVSSLPFNLFTEYFMFVPNHIYSGLLIIRQNGFWIIQRRKVRSSWKSTMIMSKILPKVRTLRISQSSLVQCK